MAILTHVPISSHNIPYLSINPSIHLIFIDMNPRNLASNLYSNMSSIHPMILKFGTCGIHDRSSVGSGTVQQRHTVLGEVDAKDSVSKINLQSQWIHQHGTAAQKKSVQNPRWKYTYIHKLIIKHCEVPVFSWELKNTYGLCIHVHLCQTNHRWSPRFTLGAAVFLFWNSGQCDVYQPDHVMASHKEITKSGGGSHCLKNKDYWDDMFDDTLYYRIMGIRNEWFRLSQEDLPIEHQNVTLYRSTKIETSQSNQMVRWIFVISTVNF